MAPKTQTIRVWSPPGFFSYPFLAVVDSGRQYSDDSFKTDLLIPKAIFKEKGKELQDAVIEVGKAHFGSTYKLKGGKQRSPFKDTDSDDAIENDRMKGCILIRAKAKPRKRGAQILPAIRPMIIGPRKVGDKFPQLSEEQIQAIKGGDWGCLQLGVYAYDQKKDGFEGGVTFGLNAVQYWKEGEALGQGRSQILETAQELECDVDEAGAADGVTDSDDDDESIV